MEYLSLATYHSLSFFFYCLFLRVRFAIKTHF